MGTQVLRLFRVGPGRAGIVKGQPGPVGAQVGPWVAMSGRGTGAPCFQSHFPVTTCLMAWGCKCFQALSSSGSSSSELGAHHCSSLLTKTRRVAEYYAVANVVVSRRRSLGVVRALGRELDYHTSAAKAPTSSLSSDNVVIPIAKRTLRVVYYPDYEHFGAHCGFLFCCCTEASRRIFQFCYRDRQ